MSNIIVKLRLESFQSQAGRCYYCNSRMWLTEKKDFALKHAISKKEAEKFKCTAEHLVARCDGGDNSKSNIVAACHFCNKGRHKRKTPPCPAEYRDYIQKRLSRGKWHPKSQHHLASRSM